MYLEELDKDNLKGAHEERSRERADWLYLVEQGVGSLTNGAADWWKESLLCAKKVYQTH